MIIKDGEKEPKEQLHPLLLIINQMIKNNKKGKFSISFKLELTTNGTTKEPNINEEIANELTI